MGGWGGAGQGQGGWRNRHENTSLLQCYAHVGQPRNEASLAATSKPPTSAGENLNLGEGKREASTPPSFFWGEKGLQGPPA